MTDDATTEPQSPPAALRLNDPDFRAFLKELGPQVSMGGMFVPSEEPLEPGTRCHLEVGLEDGFRLIAGLSEVVWTRERAQGEDRPAGMGLRFRDLEEGSRDLVFAIVERRLEEGLAISEGAVELETLLSGAAERRRRAERPAAESPPPEPPPLRYEVEPDSLELPETDELPAPSDETAAPPAGEDQGAEEVDPSSVGLELEPEDELPPEDPEPRRSFDDEPVDAVGDVEESDEVEPWRVPQEPRVPQWAPEAPSEPAPAPLPAREPVPPRVRAADFEPLLREEVPSPELPFRDAPPPEPGEDSHRDYGRRDRRPRWQLSMALLAPLLAVGVVALLLWLLREPILGLLDSGKPPQTLEGEAGEPGSALPPAASELASESEPAPPPPSAEPEPETPPPPPAPDIEPAPAEPAAELSALEEISWSSSPQGLRLVLRFDGTVTSGAMTRSRLTSGTVRELIRIRGVERPFGPGSVAVGAGGLERVRTGLHRRSGGRELHVVLDLAGPEVSVGATEIEGSRMVLTIRAGGESTP